VVDTDRHLIGSVGLQDLIIAPAGIQIIRSAWTTTSKTLARKIVRYDVITPPVIDAQERLVGIITHDDASDVLEVEATGTFRGGRDIAIVIALWMVVIVIVGGMVAMLLPFIVSRFRMDPSTACAPLVTSIPDVTGVLIYFSIEKAILSLP